MLISIATGVGLQKKIHEKVSAFNGDIIISNFDTNFSNDSQNPISKTQDFYPKFTSIEGVNTYKLQPLKEELLGRQQILKELL